MPISAPLFRLALAQILLQGPLIGDSNRHDGRHVVKCVRPSRPFGAIGEEFPATHTRDEAVRVHRAGRCPLLANSTPTIISFPPPTPNSSAPRSSSPASAPPSPSRPACSPIPRSEEHTSELQ